MLVADSDLEWLRNYAPPKGAPPLHQERVERLCELIENLITKDRLPCTIGLFGGWGSGKTTFLSLLANQIIATVDIDYKVIYFNAWKYAGFTEIVPSMIYKVLRFGNHASKDPGEAISEIIVSLGKRYSDTIGEWAKDHIGVNPVELFKSASDIYSTISEGVTVVPQAIIEAYYTQIDRAQDLLAQIFSDRSKITVVLIDELDRCDPDEAFAVIKQLRIFFAMRNLPIAFVVCANPEPIGLAIKHKFGLSTATGDYEARRILEKFVDVYIDMTEPTELDAFVFWLWKNNNKKIDQYALVVRIDDAFVNSNRRIDPIRNATALQAIKTDNPLYGNLRLLRKTFERVCSRVFPNSHMLWTAWHLEIAEQMDPHFRREIISASSDIVFVALQAYKKVLTSRLTWHEKTLDQEINPGGTIFGAYRSAFWEACKQRLSELEKDPEPEARERARILSAWMSDFRRMDFIVIMSLVPGNPKGDLKRLLGAENMIEPLQDVSTAIHQFGYLLASY